MTNAHVVAGVTEPKVRVGTRDVDATRRLLQLRLDVAVLDVDIEGPIVRFDIVGHGQAGRR